MQDSDKPVTKGMLNEAVDTLLKGMDNLYERFKGEITPLKEDVKGIKTEITFIKKDIKDIKAELSDTPTRREFNDLKDKVDQHLEYHRD